MIYLFYLIVMAIFIIFLISLFIKYNYNKIKEINTYILNTYNNYIISKLENKYFENNIIDFLIVNGTFIENILDRTMNGIQYIKNNPTFIFLTNLTTNEILTYYGTASNTNYPNNNMNVDKYQGFIYGGYFIAANGNGDFICVKGNNGKVALYNQDNIILSFIKVTDDHIIITNIMYNNEELILININQSMTNKEDIEYFKNLGNILMYIKDNYILNDKKFIICGTTLLNSKYIDLLIKTIFSNDSVISSCYNDIISYVNYENNIFLQPTFILLDKRLCPYGIRFGIRYPTDEITMYSLLLYAIIYNDNQYQNTIEYYTDPLSINILESIKSVKEYTDELVNWNNIDTSLLDLNFEYNKDLFISDDSNYNKQKIIDVLDDIKNNIS